MQEVQEGETGDNLPVVSESVAVPEVAPGWLSRISRAQRGMTTAEYAVGTVAAVTFVGVLIKVLRDPAVFELIMKLITWVLKQFWGG